MNILKYIKSIFKKDYYFNHYEAFVVNSIINASHDEFKDIINNQLNHIQFTVNLFDYHRYIRFGFTKFSFKKDLSNIMQFDIIRKSNLLAEVITVDKHNYEYKAYLYIDENGLIDEIKYFSSKIAIRNKFLPKKPYTLKEVIIYEY